MKSMKKEIKLCNNVYIYELQRKKVKNLNLHVKPDGSIYVSAPKWVSESRIESFIKSNEVKICALIEKFNNDAKRTPMPENYTDGEAFCYLGEVKRLKVVQAEKNGAELRGDILYLFLKETENADARKRLFEKWLKDESQELLLKICRDYYPYFCPPLTEFPDIRFRKMRSRWGSCTPKKNLLTFNSCLACVPLECIEYVAAHEFTHFIRPDHSANFYAELSSFMPNQRERERKLHDFIQIPKQFML